MSFGDIPDRLNGQKILYDWFNSLRDAGVLLNNYTYFQTAALYNQMQAFMTANGFLPPAMTTTARDALTGLTAGLVIYNTTTSQLNYYNGTLWAAVGLPVPEYDNGNSTSAKTISWSSGSSQRITLNTACTLTFTNPYPATTYQLKLIQDATGGRLVTWPASVKWPGGVAPVLTLTGSRKDFVHLYYDGTNYFGRYFLNYT